MEETQLSDLDMAKIEIHDPDFVNDPHAVYSAARKKNWLARFPMGYVVLDQQAMRDVLTDDRCRTPIRDISAMVGVEKGTPFARFYDHFLLALDGETHRRLRMMLAPAFTQKEAAKYRPFMNETINRIIDSLNGAAECDFTKVAARYPITVICDILGVSTDDIDRFEEWVIVLSDAFSLNEETVAKVNWALAHLFDYVEELVDARRNQNEKKDDLLQTLVDLATDGESLSDEELRVLLINLISAGYDTTKNQLILMMKVLLDHPEEWSKVADDPGRVQKVVDESLRFYNPVSATFRVTNVDIDYRGTLIPKDTMLMLPLTYAGRDESFYDSPDTFNPDRDMNRSITFGWGIHFCIGMFMARALLEEALSVLVERMKNPRLAGKPVFRHFSGMVGMEALPVSFDPA